jgi:hypothetical protein
MLFGLLKPSEKKCSLEVNIAEATALVTRLAGKLVHGYPFKADVIP